VWALTANRDRPVGRFGELAVRAPDSGADVAERVPAFDQDEQPRSIVSETHVGRAARVRRTSRQLERAVVAGSPAQAQHELLDREVAGIGGFLARVASQLDPHRSIHGEGEALPGVEGVAAASAALDRSDRGSAKPDSRTNLSLGQTPSTPGGTQLPAEPGHLL
jgi:hypothetical protein